MYLFFGSFEFIVWMRRSLWGGIGPQTQRGIHFYKRQQKSSPFFSLINFFVQICCFIYFFEKQKKLFLQDDRYQNKMKMEKKTSEIF